MATAASGGIVVIQETQALTQLSAQIKAEYQAHQAALASAQKALSVALDHAGHCGEYLLQAHRQMQVQQWGQWLTAHLSLSEQAAQAYMDLTRDVPGAETVSLAENCAADRWTRLSADIQHFTQLPPEPFPWQDLPTFQAHCRRSNDVWLTHLYLLEAMGKPVPEMARLTDHTVDQVERALSPRYLDRFPPYHHDDDSSWHSLRVFFDTNLAQVKTAYEWQCHSLVSFWMWAAKRHASQVAARYGWDCAAELRAVAQAAQREKNRYSETQGNRFLARTSRDPFFAALHACACEDARYAVGFEAIDRFQLGQQPIVIWIIEKMTFFQWLYDLSPAQRKQSSPQQLLALAQAQQAHPWVIETLQESPASVNGQSLQLL
jgi:hypothetical protein